MDALTFSYGVKHVSKVAELLPHLQFSFFDCDTGGWSTISV